MNRKWTLTELEQLKELFPDTETKIISKKIGRNISGIYRKSKQLGLKRSSEFIENQQKMFAETLRREGLKTRFSKGLVPFTKGKKREDYMSAEGIEKVKQTQFKKGSVPHNWVPIGHERITIDGYVEVKINDFVGENSNMNFVLKHRLVWVQNNGPIPEGVNVEFIDGDKRNFALNNLVLRSRSENLMNNCFSKRSIAKKMFKPKSESELNNILENVPELLTAKQTQIKINKIIRDHERKN